MIIKVEKGSDLYNKLVKVVKVLDKKRVKNSESNKYFVLDYEKKKIMATDRSAAHFLDISQHFQFEKLCLRDDKVYELKFSKDGYLEIGKIIEGSLDTKKMFDKKFEVFSEKFELRKRANIFHSNYGIEKFLSNFAFPIQIKYLKNLFDGTYKISYNLDSFISVFEEDDFTAVILGIGQENSNLIKMVKNCSMEMTKQLINKKSDYHFHYEDMETEDLYKEAKKSFDNIFVENKEMSKSKIIETMNFLNMMFNSYLEE